MKVLLLLVLILPFTFLIFYWCHLTNSLGKIRANRCLIECIISRCNKLLWFSSLFNLFDINFTLKHACDNASSSVTSHDHQSSYLVCLHHSLQLWKVSWILIHIYYFLIIIIIMNKIYLIFSSLLTGLISTWASKQQPTPKFSYG